MAEMTTTIYLGDLGDMDVTVSYTYIPADRGCHTMNGDPGWPPTPAEIDINSVVCNLTNFDITKLVNASKDCTAQLEMVIEEAEEDRKHEAQMHYADRGEDWGYSHV